ncbi:MAG TPA: site-specific DNA-methyltransferase, partial [Sulfurovum sp.]|nr:site-specific DNA-methyltransferase [Sulfurovum sp.]
MKKLDGKSLDIVEENVKKLKELFPEILCEGKIDFESLEALLGKYVEREDERYAFTWHGKTKAKRIAQTPTTATLRPDKEESLNWEDTQNIFIEGDNLEVLKLLQKSYYKKVKMIYIDPPYNTGKDFIYKDNYKEPLKSYKVLTGQVDEEGNPLSTNTDTSGRYHSNWLNMIYPRLKLARNLLRDDGVIFISIDDREVHNLRKICDEIFGEGNFLYQLTVVNNLNGNDNSSGM